MVFRSATGNSTAEQTLIKKRIQKQFSQAPPIPQAEEATRKYQTLIICLNVRKSDAVRELSRLFQVFEK